MKFINGFIALLLLASVSCTSGKKEEKADAGEAANKQEQGYDVANAKVNWTAYKFNEKVGVGGTFDEVQVTPGGAMNSAEEMLTNGSFSIPVVSVNSNNAIRDPKIKDQFFGVMTGSDISGKIISANNGKGQMELMMNSITKSIDYHYTKTDSALVLRSSISVLDWEGKAALDSLNKVCEALHKGQDGESKLWPDVDIEVLIPVKKEAL